MPLPALTLSSPDERDVYLCSIRLGFPFYGPANKARYQGAELRLMDGNL